MFAEEFLSGGTMPLPKEIFGKKIAEDAKNNLESDNVNAVEEKNSAPSKIESERSPEEILKTVFGYDSFRSLQKQIIESVLSGRDTIAIMPTGGGKSICYQVPALIFSGLTIVISPLIALMQDQVSALNAAGVDAVFLNSTLSAEQYSQSLSKIRSGKAKLVYVSPEGLNTQGKLDFFERAEVSCITIDEAHCVSEWGHDFRPDYLEIAGIRQRFPRAVCLALTATATAQVRSDIAKNLGMINPAEFVASFNRENIYLCVKPKRNYYSQITDFLKKHDEDSGIIYCMSRKMVDELTKRLSEDGFSAVNYHAGLSDSERAKHQTAFLRDKKQIMVATVAFGMGINKPNVRFVIHCDMPKSIEQYYQEIGRAGRDGLPSEALLLYSASDIQRLRYFFTDLEPNEKKRAESLLQGMAHYAESHTCRRKQILQYFGESFESEKKTDGTCCDICDAGDALMTDVTIPALKFLSCVIRTKQRFGAGYVTDVLLGSKAQRILDNAHDKLSTYGIGRGISRASWLELAAVLADEGYIIKSGEYNVLLITNKAREAINTKAKIVLPLFLEEEDESSKKMLDTSGVSALGRLKKRGERKIVPAVFDESDSRAVRIAEALKEWRKRTAEESNVPPYIIFNDKTLSDIAAKKPRTHDALLDIFGLGKAKSDRYGSAIIRIIADNS